jgi:hypothetical protein
MDRLTDRLAALAEEVGELAQPPGAAVTVWRARRRRRRAVTVAGVGLLSVVVGGLLLNPLGRDFPDAGPPRPIGRASSPATTHRPGSLGPIHFGPRKVAPGGQLRVGGSGCKPFRYGQVSLDPSDGVALGMRQLFPIDKDGRYSMLLTVPRTATAGTYDLTVRCLSGEHGDDASVVRDAVVVTKPKK